MLLKRIYNELMYILHCNAHLLERWFVKHNVLKIKRVTGLP